MVSEEVERIAPDCHVKAGKASLVAYRSAGIGPH